VIRAKELEKNAIFAFCYRIVARMSPHIADMLLQVGFAIHFEQITVISRWNLVCVVSGKILCSLAHYMRTEAIITFYSCFSIFTLNKFFSPSFVGRLSCRTPGIRTRKLRIMIGMTRERLDFRLSRIRRTAFEEEGSKVHFEHRWSQQSGY
jgi:hypothetical protein